VRHARCSFPQQEVEIRHVRSLIDSNTVALVGSAPQYASGTIDPMEELSALALARNIGLHVDCCLGGFLVPFMEKAGLPPAHAFDFRLAGVTSISCDPHKYGFAPKGASVLLFRSPALRHHMYTFATQWTGGIYATPTMLGSRPGGAVAGTWAAMMRYGEDGYVESTRSIVQATRHIAAAIPSVDGLELVGRADACVVAFGARKDSGLNCYAVADCLKEVGGWELATLQNPPAVHLAVTMPTSRNAERFVADLRTAVARVRALPEKYKGGSAGLYGMASSLPTGFIEETVKVYLDTMSACPGDD
jgi:sphinganine-1-phosphate aldolase